MSTKHDETARRAEAIFRSTNQLINDAHAELASLAVALGEWSTRPRHDEFVFVSHHADQLHGIVEGLKELADEYLREG